MTSPHAPKQPTWSIWKYGNIHCCSTWWCSIWNQTTGKLNQNVKGKNDIMYQPWISIFNSALGERLSPLAKNNFSEISKFSYNLGGGRYYDLIDIYWLNKYFHMFFLLYFILKKEDFYRVKVKWKMWIDFDMISRIVNILFLHFHARSIFSDAVKNTAFDSEWSRKIWKY